MCFSKPGNIKQIADQNVESLSKLEPYVICEIEMIKTTLLFLLKLFN